MNTPIFVRVRDIAADILQVEPGALIPESSPETIGSWDSLQHLNLVLALEEAFGLQFEPEEMERMKNIGQIAAMVAAKAGA